ncbi:MAG: hypothetical protein FWF22_05740, partial [Treponema sp.]|nr:hypothetical protein [Treponema sp.]
MKKVGMISVTLNSVGPMLELFAKRTGFEKSFCVLNYIDDGLQQLVGQEGKVTDKSICRLIALIETAILDG